MATAPIKPKSFLRSSITVGEHNRMTISDVRELARQEPEAFIRKCEQAILDQELSWRSIGNLKNLYQAICDVPVKATIEDSMGGTRAITASAFPLLSSHLTIAGINEAYSSVPTIGEQLVTEMDDNKKETAVGLILANNPKDVDTIREGEDFPQVGASEEFVTISHRRDGRQIVITAEAIEENDVSGIVDRINFLGRWAAKSIEVQTLKRVYDYDGSAASGAAPYVYKPNGAGTALYSATANTPGTRAPNGTRINNNALVDYTDIDNARTRLVSMKTDLDDRLSMSELTLLVPDALLSIAFRILNSEFVPGTVNEINPVGPRGYFRTTLLSSPRLDDLSTTCWHLGAFQRQFRRKWKLRQEIVSLTQDMSQYLSSRTAYRARIAWDCEVGAIDYPYVVQCLSGTTAPKDD